MAHMPFPKSWARRRSRKLQRRRHTAMARVGLSTAGSPLAGQTALCIAYMCPWAHACPAAAPRPALVGQRQCLRYYPQDLRPGAGLTDHAMDVLAGLRRDGVALGAVTIAVLDEFRPAGPSPSVGHRRPERPIYAGAVAGRPRR